jgi:hypothetical protein
MWRSFGRGGHIPLHSEQRHRHPRHSREPRRRCPVPTPKPRQRSIFSYFTPVYRVVTHLVTTIQKRCAVSSVPREQNLAEFRTGDEPHRNEPQFVPSVKRRLLFHRRPKTSDNIVSKPLALLPRIFAKRRGGAL